MSGGLAWAIAAERIVDASIVLRSNSGPTHEVISYMKTCFKCSCFVVNRLLKMRHVSPHQAPFLTG